MKICNIGENGKGKYKPIDYKNIYIYWTSLLNRCYNENNNSYKFYGKKGVTVCQEWHNFQNFCEWYLNQLSEYKDIEFRLNLDKDILCYTFDLKLKIYSVDTCILIPEEINYFFCDCDSINCGIQKRKDTGKYQARFTFDKKEFNLGCYEFFEDAKLAYLDKKVECFGKLLSKYKELIPIRIANILVNFDFYKILNKYSSMV